MNCQLVNNTKVCSASRQQFDNRNQRIFAVELATRARGVRERRTALRSRLAKGVALAVDDKAMGETRPFSTCLVGGCLVPLAFNAAALASLNGGGTLKVKGVALDSGREIEFAVPLAGFASAMERTAELLKD